jgi:hypothetical protein
MKCLSGAHFWDRPDAFEESNLQYNASKRKTKAEVANNCWSRNDCGYVIEIHARERGNH